ncbi:MAG: nucleotidyltransferase domain-containing protein [Verrucomicrobiales bacterium]|nr:nucleotidyltransferase domain-containing protein [Verrucomicrobiales bacterium]
MPETSPSVWWRCSEFWTCSSRLAGLKPVSLRTVWRTFTDDHRLPPSTHWLLLASIGGAHLHGFPAPDSDFDPRGANVATA